MIKENLAEVEERIRNACKKSGRSRDDVTLIAVSKTKPVSMIQEVMEEGIIDFGENKPQEMKEKYESLPKNLRWHMIGHLQRNKVKYVVPRACLIHSVDSLRLAEEISSQAVRDELTVPILIEVNVAEEDSKYGVTVPETEALIRQIAPLPGLAVRGLMTIAPFVENAEDNRPVFEKLRKLAVDIKSKSIDNVTMCELSMGMTGDYQVAIEEGATMVRVGTGIFGERHYTIE